MLRRPLYTALFLALLATILPAHGRERVALRHVTLDLPGPPSKVISVDLNGDGRQDLVIIVAYTEIENVGESYIEEMVQITTVIPFLLDRREVRAYLATEEGTYEAAGSPLKMPPSVLHMEAGPPGASVVALTDEGLSVLRFDPDGSFLWFDPVVDDPPILAETGSFYASLELVHDLDGDGTLDVLHPSLEGLSVYLGSGSGIESEPVFRLELPGSQAKRLRSHARRWYPLPEVQSVNGDDLPDLVFNGGFTSRGDRTTHVFLGTGGGRFEAMRDEELDCHDKLSDLRLAYPEPDRYPWPEGMSAFQDLDGDGRAELVTSEQQSRGQSFRKELKDAKRPIQTYRFHRLNDDLSVDPDPYYQREIVGHTMEGELDDDTEAFGQFWIQQFQDLDGDGREDLVTITLDFSIFQAIKILATKKIGLWVNFHVYAQQQDGSFEEVPDLDLSEKLKIDLNNLKVARFAQFAGDFDGDGRQDFVHLGRGKTVTVHAGQAGCRYPERPDLSIELDAEPVSLDLVRIEDLDADGRSDLRITRPIPFDDPDITAPVRLDLYLSGGAS